MTRRARRTTSSVTTRLDRLNNEAKPRADILGIFPNKGAIIGLVGAVLLKANGARHLQPRYMRSEAMTELTPPLPGYRVRSNIHLRRMIRGRLILHPIVHQIDGRDLGYGVPLLVLPRVDKHRGLA